VKNIAQQDLKGFKPGVIDFGKYELGDKFEERTITVKNLSKVNTYIPTMEHIMWN